MKIADAIGNVFNPGPLLSGSGGNNTDTLAASPQKGDLIFGNATPLWARLAHGLQYQVLMSTGASGDVPAWSYVDGNSFGSMSIANKVFAGLTSAGSAAPSFRALVYADMPNLTSIITLTDASTVAVDGSKFKSGNDLARLSLTGNHILGFPSPAPADGQLCSFEVANTGAFDVTLAAGYAGGSDVAVPSPVVASGAGQRSFLTFRYNAGLGEMLLLAYSRGYT